MSDEKVSFSEILRWDLGWSKDRIEKWMRDMDVNTKQVEFDPHLVERYVTNVQKINIEWEESVLRALNGEVLTANISEQKHIYVPGIMIPGCQKGLAGPTGTPGPTGMPGQSTGTVNNPWTGSIGGVTSSTGTTGTSGTTTTSGSYTSYFNAPSSGSNIGSVTIEGDGEEKIPSFEGDVEGIVEIEEDE